MDKKRAKAHIKDMRKENGVLIVKLDAPTNLIIDISLFLEKIVSLIVFIIKNTVTNIKAITTP